MFTRRIFGTCICKRQPRKYVIVQPTGMKPPLVTLHIHEFKCTCACTVWATGQHKLTIPWLLRLKTADKARLKRMKFLIFLKLKNAELAKLKLLGLPLRGTPNHLAGEGGAHPCTPFPTLCLYRLSMKPYSIPCWHGKIVHVV